VNRSNPRRDHPDDALRRLARPPKSGRPVITSQYPGPRSRNTGSRKVRVLVLLGLLLLGLISVPLLAKPNVITVEGLADGDTLTKEQIQTQPILFRIKPVSALKNAVLRIDGAPARVTLSEDQTALRWLPPELAEAPHVLTIGSGKGLLWRGGAKSTIRFTQDSIAPVLVLDGTTGELKPGEPFIVSGSVSENVDLTIDGLNVAVTKNRFKATFRYPPIGEVRIVATDRAGGTATATVGQGLTLPRRRGVLMPAAAWVDADRRNAMLDMANEGRINTVVLDVKNDRGEVNAVTDLASVKKFGANRDVYNLGDAVTELHRRGIRVVARIVTFRDPLASDALWSAGNYGAVVQHTDGSMVETEPGGYLNPANPAARAYLLDLARFVADKGVDEVLLDGLQRPTGRLDEFTFEGLNAIVDPVIKKQCPSADPYDASVFLFLQDAGKRLRGTPARLGAMINGDAVRLGSKYGQNVLCMRRPVDYLAPTVMPSEFTTGAFGIYDPARQPGRVVDEAVRSFRRKLGSAQAGQLYLVPWIQDYSKGRTYGPEQIRAQIAALDKLGQPSFLMWDPKATYTAEAFPADLAKATGGGASPTPTIGSIPAATSTATPSSTSRPNSSAAPSTSRVATPSTAAVPAANPAVSTKPSTTLAG
jgi:hypothetical protein